MSSTEGAFAPDTVAYGYVHQSSRDDSQEAQSSREPFVGDDVYADARGPFAEHKPADEPIPALVERLLRGGGGDAVDGLPSTLAEELRVIGRAVSFSATTAVQGSTVRYYYTGLVCAVSAAAVTLMHVQRYTEADFEAYKHRERALSVRGRGSDGAGAAALADGGACGGGLAAHGYSAEGAVGVDGDGRLCGHDDGAALRRMDAAGSLTRAPPLPACAAAVAEGDPAVFAEAARAAMGPHTRAARRRPLAACGGSVGPLPYVTVQRQRMREVRFGRDPRSSFYALFQEPEKHIEDMQYLRMFVRRYLVHTCQGNNPRQVPLYAFVAARSGCGALDRSFVYSLAREELPDLLRTDRAIEVEKKRRAAFEEQRRVSDQESDDYPSLFSNTGELISTGIPQRTFAAAIVLLFITTVLALYLIVTLTISANSLGTAFLSQQLMLLVLDTVVWTVTGVLTLVHSTSMRLPLHDNILLLTERWIFSVGSLVCAMHTLVRIGQNKSYNAIMGTSDDSGSGSFCERYSSQYCYFVWNLRWEVNDACQHCYNCRYTYSNDQCYNGIVERLKEETLTLLVISALAVFSSLFTLFELLKLCVATRARYLQVPSVAAAESQ